MPSPARYDLPWKAALTHAFRAFMDFFFSDLCKEIDWSRRPRYRDKELAGIALADAPNVMVADKLVEVALRDGRVQWVLIHIEVQAQRDKTLARRVLDYNYRIFQQYQQPVASLVLLADEDANWRPSAFHNTLLGTQMGISFATAKLLDYATRSDLETSPNPFALVTLAHLRTQQARHDPDALYAAKWHLTKLLYQHRWSKARIITMFKVINWMMALPEAQQERYRQTVFQLKKENNMTNPMKWITPLEEMILDEGMQKGAAIILERQLTRRFGPLSKTNQRKLAKASVEQLTAWSDAVLDAASLKQVFETQSPAD
ncbi:hypothetical protein FHW58_003044 [Duganella sp. 1224]|uniref:DUF4351 domain-containing protein n=1 Tax=Duganella sp. 1224 TaxID=2587052 RepID=UPI0015C7AD34|nr:DUF4351 domain-containing protein [Duganella sp. 1224]NYE61837.1 hypothetical protein [Duganella sp. 1224]